MFNILLDTNALIAFQDANRLLPDNIASAIRESSGQVKFFIHPRQLLDIARDKNEKRKAVLSSRIKQYSSVPSAPAMTSRQFIDDLGWSCNSENDFVDNHLLLCIKKPVMHYLVTEDKKIHAKAKKSGLESQVLTISGLRDFAHSLVEKKALDTTIVFDKKCHELELNDIFFDSLRDAYGQEEFDRWFVEKCALNQRDCWVVHVNNCELGALCIYKIEDDSFLTEGGFRSGTKNLKLCTIKVGEELRGTKVGEKILFKAFSYSRENDIEFVYFHTDEAAQPELVSLATDFGFSKVGAYAGDAVFGKYLKPQTPEEAALEKADYLRRFYPDYKDDEEVAKYLIPIQKRWHEQLFPDVSDFRKTLLGELQEMYSSESNTIRKAYICRAGIQSITPGDLLLFYRSQDRKSIEVMAAVVSVTRSADIKEISSLVEKRTVYHDYEISDMLRGCHGGLLIICFDVLDYFRHPVTLKDLKELGMYHPQSISSLKEDDYKKILRKARS